MSNRLLLSLAGFVFIVGGGALWLGLQWIKRKKLKDNLLALPKERRFFWYQLKEAGYEVLARDQEKQASLYINGEKRKIGLKLEFMAHIDRRKYACVFSGGKPESELLTLFYVYISVFQIQGVIFFDEETKTLQIWEE
jgi:hypothetical protein